MKRAFTKRLQLKMTAMAKKLVDSIISKGIVINAIIMFLCDHDVSSDKYRLDSYLSPR